MIQNPFLVGAISSGAVELLEGLTVLFGLLLAFPLARFGSRFCASAERWCARLARRRKLAIVIAGALPMAMRLLLLPILPVPVPAIHEEFSNLLEADTFAAGRLSNPEHPMALYLETFQVLQHPTYCSIRPPGYAAFLALGDAMGSSWVGVWLSVGVMCAAVCWMLQGWLPPGWALFGAVLLGLRLGVLGYWMNSYWGGSVTALGGALALGALPRLKRCLTWVGALPFGVGIVVIASTRIYEGFFFLLPIGASVAAWLFRDKSYPVSAKWLRSVAPAALMLALFAVWSGYYDWRTTGSATSAPYTAYRAHYSSAPPFIWQHVEPHTYSNAEMRSYFTGWEVPYFQRIASRSTYASELLSKALASYHFYIRPAFLLPLFLLPWMIRDRRIRLLWAILAAELVAALMEVWGAPYYFAVLTCVIYLIILQGMRHLRQVTWNGRPTGIFLVRWIAFTVVGIFVFSVGLQAYGIRVKDPGIFFFSPGLNLMEARARVQYSLEAMPGKHLLMVRYASDHNPHEEWVWNSSNVDGAKVVWTRDLGAEGEKRLVAYFRDRDAYIVEPDRTPVLISRYPRGK